MSELLRTAKEIITFPKFGVKPMEERRASVFGMIQSGKTTLLALLEIICINLAAETNKPGSKTKFHSLIVERSSGIRQIAGEMRQGMFPEKTPPGHTFEADYLMRWGTKIGQRQIRLPFCETAGETFTAMLERWGSGQYDIDPDMQDSELIFDYVLNTDAIILILPVTRPLGIEEEIGAPLNLPDVNAARLTSGVLGYKMEDEKLNPQHKPIKGIAVFLTKLDAAQKTLGSQHINLKTRQGIHDFMSRYFPETYATLSWYGLDNVRFWPTGLEIEKERDPITKKIKGKLHPLNPARGYKIKVNYARNMPMGDYEEQMLEFIDWLKDTVMA